MSTGQSGVDTVMTGKGELVQQCIHDRKDTQNRLLLHQKTRLGKDCAFRKSKLAVAVTDSYQHSGHNTLQSCMTQRMVMLLCCKSCLIQEWES